MISNDSEIKMTCRQTRKHFTALDNHSLTISERAAAEHHLADCSRCALEFRLFGLQRATLDAAASAEPVVPDEHFFKGLRARIARGIETAPLRLPDESWTGALLLTAKQLIPAMAVLLLLMAGATLFWGEAQSGVDRAALRPRERVVFGDMYDYPAPTRDDVLETLVALEEK
jgi:predicted anti-sigma-YlaC factor YlaD